MELVADGGTTGLITMGLANLGVGDFDFALGVTELAS